MNLESQWDALKSVGWWYDNVGVKRAQHVYVPTCHKHDIYMYLVARLGACLVHTYLGVILA